MGLTAVTYLGPNTVPILDELSSYLTDATGTGVSRDGPPRSSKQAIDAERDSRGDLVWACGHLTMQLRTSDPGCLDIVGTPVFAGETAPVYHAVIVAQQGGTTNVGEAMDLRLGINEIESWSGHLGLRDHLIRQGINEWFGDITLTGSHVKSLQALAAGSVDLVSVDNTVWAQLRHDPPAWLVPRLDELVVIDRTADWPAPPISLGSDVPLATGLRIREALGELSPGDVAGLDGVRPATHHDYAEMTG